MAADILHMHLSNEIEMVVIYIIYARRSSVFGCNTQSLALEEKSE